ncbi:MAG: 16S rRNA (adenine(1518)-N(6)/adenine(1519)-N(6))-dimethyltransferase RsmA [Sedimentisphaerales bacterium]
MQTKSQIEQLLLSAGVRPNKRFGQHFLIDLNLMRLLVDTANAGEEDVVLEVGCGTGSLTEAIAEQAGFCIAVEVDEILADIARTQLADKSNVEIIVVDVLENKFAISPIVIDAMNRARATYKGRLILVSNLPYVAATPLMLNLITGTTTVDAMYVTVQKEVADRMTAHPGVKDYGILSILLAVTGEVRHIRTLRPSVFWPQPQVDSAMISFVRRKDKIGRIYNMELFSEVVNLFMQHRRKMVKGCVKFTAGKLSEIDNWSEIFERCRIDPRNRPEQLRPEDFIAISNLCNERLASKS